MLAVTANADHTVVVKTIAIPDLPPDYIRVRIHAIAVNPTDWKHLQFIPVQDAIVGCDVAGTVTAVQENGLTRAWQVGDRVLGFTPGNGTLSKEKGAFAETAMIKSGLAIRVPKHLSWEEAASLGVGLVTIGQAFFQSLKLRTLAPHDPEAFSWGPGKDRGPWLLIYGASTATATLGIQIAKLAGYRTIAVCDPSHFPRVRRLGADTCFNRHSTTCGADINAFTGNQLFYAFDCIATNDTAKLCCQALSTRGPIDGRQLRYTALDPVEQLPRTDVQSLLTVGYTATGEAWGDKGARPEDYDFIVGWMSIAERLLADGKIDAHPQDSREGGLKAVAQALEDLKTGKVSGKKIVIRV